MATSGGLLRPSRTEREEMEALQGKMRKFVWYVNDSMEWARGDCSPLSNAIIR